MESTLEASARRALDTSLNAEQREELRRRRLLNLQTMKYENQMTLAQIAAQRAALSTWEEDLQPPAVELEGMQNEEAETRRRVAAIDAAIAGLLAMAP